MDYGRRDRTQGSQESLLLHRYLSMDPRTQKPNPGEFWIGSAVRSFSVKSSAMHGRDRILEKVDSNLTCSKCSQLLVVEDQTKTGSLQSCLGCFNCVQSLNFIDLTSRLQMLSIYDLIAMVLGLCRKRLIEVAMAPQRAEKTYRC